MSRPRKFRRDLPPRMYFNDGSYYHVARGKWTRLGRDLVEALRAYHERELSSHAGKDLTFSAASSRYLALGTTDLAPRTVKDYTQYVARLNAVFGEVLLDDIEPHHVKQYHRLAAARRGNVQANREKACLSLVWNWARGEGHTSRPNPCAGIHRAEERPRSVLVSDTTYRRVWVHADWPTRDAMDLARFTGQRPADVFKLRLTDIRDGCLVVNQAKRRGKAIVRVQIEGKLKLVIDRIKARKYKITSTALVRNERGERLTPSAFDNRFEDARRKAGVKPADFQFRDLRAKGGTEKADRDGETRPKSCSATRRSEQPRSMCVGGSERK